jgi:hypothetical protein
MKRHRSGEDNNKKNQKRRKIEIGVKINCPFDRCKRTIYQNQKYCFQHLERGNEKEIKSIFFSGKCDIVIPNDIIIYIFLLGQPYRNQIDIKSYKLDTITSYYNDRLILSKTIYKLLNPYIRWNKMWFNSSYSERIPIKMSDIQIDDKSVYVNKKDLSIPTNYNARKFLAIKLHIDRLEKQKSILQKHLYEESTGIKRMDKKKKFDYPEFIF